MAPSIDFQKVIEVQVQQTYLPLVRIIAGENGGRKLFSPEGQDTRPTSDAHRETAFNIISNGLGHEMTHVLDLFSGTGALGLEAHSRGAQEVVFVEKNPKAIACIHKNAELCKLSGSHMLVIREPTLESWSRLLGALPDARLPFDTIFCDPPYGKKLVERAMKALEPKAERLFLKDRSLLMAETSADDDLPSLPEGWELIKERKKGSTQLLFYRRVK